MRHALILLGLAASAGAQSPERQPPLDTSWVRVKQAIAESLTPEQLEAHKQRLARNFAASRGLRHDIRTGGPRTPGDACTTATYELGSLPYGPIPDTTVGATDDFDLPPDTTSPTCTAASTCTGAGPAGSLPRGAVYTGTGTGPDRAFRILFFTDCTVTITMDPTGTQDLALIVYESSCSSSLADCACVDDTGVGGVAEQVVLDAVAGTTYFVVVDGYSTGGTPPGPAGPYTFSLSGPGCGILVPVELQDFAIE